MERILRSISNKKQDSIKIAKSQPSSQSMREGEELFYVNQNGQLSRYKKQYGILWRSDMSKDGNHYIDRDLSVNNKLIIKDHPAFFAYQSTSADAQSVADTTKQIVHYDKVRYDNGSNYDTTNYKFTAPYTGVYHFNAKVLWSNTNTGDWALEDRHDIMLYKNETSANPSTTNNRVAHSMFITPLISDFYQMSFITTDLKLEKNDTIKVYMQQLTGSTIKTHATTEIDDFTHFSGHLVCAM